MYIRNEIRERLVSMDARGRSKHQDKKTGTTHNKIYSTSTFKTYSKACQNFATYAIKNSEQKHKITMQEARAYARGFIQSEIDAGKSAYTIAMERSALAKLYGVDGVQIHENIPTRKVEDIKRSRERTIISDKTGKEIKNPSSRAGHFSEKNNKAIVDFCKSTGLRRMELSRITGDQLRKDSKGYYIDIKNNQGKGGKPRKAYVIGNVDNVVQLMQSAGQRKVFEKIPQKMDVHHYRREYATEFYNKIARDPKTLPIGNKKKGIEGERYVCRRDKKGVIYDKKALLEVSRALGHNRVSVVAEHYLMR